MLSHPGRGHIIPSYNKLKNANRSRYKGNFRSAINFMNKEDLSITNIVDTSHVRFFMLV